jgi:hypothetical protein
VMQNTDYSISGTQPPTAVSSPLFFGLTGSSNRVDWWMVGRRGPQDTNMQVDQHFSQDHRRKQLSFKS